MRNMRNNVRHKEEIARAEAQWLTVPDWDAPKRKISRKKSILASNSNPKRKPPEFE